MNSLCWLKQSLRKVLFWLLRHSHLSIGQHIFIIHTILYISVNSEDTLIKRQVHLRQVLNEPTSFDSRCLSWGISGLKAAKRSKKWQIAFFEILGFHLMLFICLPTPLACCTFIRKYDKLHFSRF
jgi:hypothetical protein